MVVPVYNERESIEETIRLLVKNLAGTNFELIVINDGSSDGTAKILDELQSEYPFIITASHECNRGYGAALKTGIRMSRSEFVAITDADTTYPNERIPELVGLAKNADMVVGARITDDVTYSITRTFPKMVLSAYSSWLARRRIPDLNSGLRVMRKSVVERFLRILPDSFSFTTTITLARLINYYNVRYVPISYAKRIGKSKIDPIRDTLRFVALIIRTGIYFAPLRVFLPVAMVFGIAFVASFVFDLMNRDLTEKTLMLLSLSLSTTMFALLADMIDKRTEKIAVQTQPRLVRAARSATARTT